MNDLSIYQPSNLLYNQEKMSRYQPNGFHPVSLGDTLKEGQYKIHHKLGWGGFSTVWLAWDSVSEMWVSIKIRSADSNENDRELAALRTLDEKDGSSQQHIVRLLDDFLHDGPNGRHQCLVLEFLGLSVDTVVNDYRQSGDQLDPETVLKITTQMLGAISFLHKAGYAHGDISGSNIAFTCPKLARLSQDDLFTILGRPESEALTRLDNQPLQAGLPSQLVQKADWEDWIDEDDEDIQLIDFGEAFLHQEPKPDALAQPPDMRAPETIFTTDGHYVFDHRLDLWRAGITIYSILFGTRPFQHWGGTDKLVLQMIDFVEELPVEWESQWQVMQTAAAAGEKEKHPDRSHSDSLIRKASVTPTTNPKLDQKFQESITDPTLQCLLPVIRGLTRFRPADRITAAEALDMVRAGQGGGSSSGEE